MTNNIPGIAKPMKLKTPNTRISASRLALRGDCSLKYKFRYVDKIQKPAQSIHLAYGSAVHKGLETLNRALMKGDTHLSDVFHAFDKCWIKEIKEQNIRDSFYNDKLYHMGLNALDKFYNEFVDYEVIGAEQKFEVPIIYADGKTEPNHTLYGFIDGIIKRKDKVMVIDYKTAKEAYKKFILDTSLQLSVYSYAVRHMITQGELAVGKKEQEDFIAYYLLIKDYDTLNGEIKMQRKKVDNYNRLFYNIKQLIKADKHKIFVPNYLSNCHWCEYKKECLEFNK